MINMTYDESTDAAYIYLVDRETVLGKVARTTLADHIIKKVFLHICPFYALDFDSEKKLLGIEILDASKYLPKQLIDYLKNLEKMRKEPRELAPGC